MKKILLVICLATMFTLTGCATTKTLQPVNGSKADGTITLSYEYGMFEKPVVDWDLAKATAKTRCVAWGYKNAEAFSGKQEHCLEYSSGSCMRMQVNIIYQCT